jgi:hypothetical protein
MTRAKKASEAPAGNDMIYGGNGNELIDGNRQR